MPAAWTFRALASRETAEIALGIVDWDALARGEGKQDRDQQNLHSGQHIGADRAVNGGVA